MRDLIFHSEGSSFTLEIKMSDDSKKAVTGHKLSDFKAQVACLANGGNKPEEWKEYIDSVKSRIDRLGESKQKAMSEIIYSTAVKAIPDTSKTLAYASLLVDYADFKSKYDLAEAEKLLFYCRYTLGNFAIVHVASAELELKKGNKDKAVRILQKAKRSLPEQGDIINLSLQKIHDGRISLLGDNVEEDRFGEDTSPANGTEISEDLNMSQFSGYIGERDLLKMSLSGSRSNTQEMQQGLSNYTPFHDEHLVPKNKFSPPLGRIKDSLFKDENQDPELFSGTSSCLSGGNVQTTSPPSSEAMTANISSSSTFHSISSAKTVNSPRPVSDFPQQMVGSANNKLQLNHDDGQSALRSESTNNMSRQPLASLLKIPETPDLKQPSPAKKKSLHHFHSTPVLGSHGGAYGSSIKKSLRKFHPRNPLPPPRRVKVDPALKSLWDDDEDGDDKSDFTVSDFPLLDKDSKMYTSTGESKTSESSEIQTEPQGLQDIRSVLNNQLTGHSLYSKHDLSSHDLNASQVSFPKKLDSSSFKVNPPQEKKFLLGRQRHVSATENIKERFEVGRDDKIMSSISNSGDSSQGCELGKFVHKLATSQRNHPSTKVPPESSELSSIASSLKNPGCPQPFEIGQRLFQEQQEQKSLVSSAKHDSISRDCHASQQNIHRKTDANSSKVNFSQEKKLQVKRDQHLSSSEERPEALGSTDLKTNTSSSGVSSQGTQSATFVQKLTTGQKAQLPGLSLAESSASASVVSSINSSAHAQSLELKQKLFQEQQNLVKQQVLEQQQQQMKQPAVANPTYSVHSRIPSAGNVAYITPAKQTLGADQKTLYVNGMPYSVIRKVGRGGSAKVYQVFDQSVNKICALKVVNLSCANSVVLEGFKNEIALLKKLQHCDRVIKLFDSEYNPSSQKLFLVLEYGEIDLDNFIAQNVTSEKQLSPSTIFYFWLQMVTAVHAMHSEGVIHSDLKPPNFILVSGVVKLIDFGIANSIQQDSTSVLKDIKMGTPSYMSPEMLVANTAGSLDNKPRYKVGKRSDVWSLGCILYQMVYGRTPFQNVPDKIHAIINPNHPINFPHRDDPALMDVLKKCLQRDVSLRPTTEELLKHPYFQMRNTVSTNATSNLPPTLESKLSLIETVLSSSSPRTKKALEHKFKEFYSSA